MIFIVFLSIFSSGDKLVQWSGSGEIVLKST